MTILIRLIKSSILKLRLRAKEHFSPLFRPMSKTFRPFLLVFAVVIQILHLFNNSNAQSMSATITVYSDKQSIVHVEGKFGSDPSDGGIRNLSFLQEYAGISKLGERVSDVRLSAADGSAVKCRSLMPGEYLADKEFVGWEYNFDATPPIAQMAYAHISWFTNDGGILFLSDLLPLTKSKSDVSLSVQKMMADGSVVRSVIYEDTVVHDKQTGVVPFFSPRSRGLDERRGTTTLLLMLDGAWKFKDDVAFKAASGIFDAYEELFGSSTSRSVDISIRPFPIPVAAGNYEADTRGNNITIISSDTLFETESVQRLHEQLRHEIFHLWIPNGVNLTGNYDWFYEGFALYQSLKTGVALNRIRFDDYLDTLSRAYDIDRRLGQKLSLIEVSKNRWTGDNNTRVYARGMLVAFLCDLALLEKSKGKRSVESLLRQLYERDRPPAVEQDANTAVLSLLRSYSELMPIIGRNIIGADGIEWNEFLKGAGLEVESADQATKLTVIARPSGRQKNILDKLGYNNWRKLASK
jgi:hypothetical protein